MNELNGYLKTSFDKRVLFDTGVAIDYLMGDKRAQAFFEEFVFTGQLTPVLSSQSVCELFMAARNKKEETNLSHWVSSVFDVASVDYEIAKQAGLLKRGTKSTSSDMIIAATALILRIPLITTNPSPYRKAEIRIFAPYT